MHLVYYYLPLSTLKPKWLREPKKINQIFDLIYVKFTDLYRQRNNIMDMPF